MQTQQRGVTNPQGGVNGINTGGPGTPEPKRAPPKAPLPTPPTNGGNLSTSPPGPQGEKTPPRNATPSIHQRPIRNQEGGKSPVGSPHQRVQSAMNQGQHQPKPSPTQPPRPATSMGIASTVPQGEQVQEQQPLTQPPKGGNLIKTQPQPVQGNGVKKDQHAPPVGNGDFRPGSPPVPPKTRQAKVVLDYQANGPDQLSLRSGEIVVVLAQNGKMWAGSVGGRVSLFVQHQFLHLVDTYGQFVKGGRVSSRSCRVVACV